MRMSDKQNKGFADPNEPETISKSKLIEAIEGMKEPEIENHHVYGNKIIGDVIVLIEGME